MSKERKTLKILSLIMWVLSLVFVVGAIHGAIKAMQPLLFSYALVMGLVGFYTGWQGIQGANTPSKVGAQPKYNIVIAIASVIWSAMFYTNHIEALNHGPQMITYISIVMFVVAVLSCMYGKKVSEQVTL